MVCWQEMLCAWLLVPGRTTAPLWAGGTCRHASGTCAHPRSPAIPYGAPSCIRAPSTYALKPPCRQRLRLHKQTSAALGLKSVSGCGPCPAARCRCTFTIASAGARGAAATNRTRGCCCSRKAHALWHGEEARARWRYASGRGCWGQQLDAHALSCTLRSGGSRQPAAPASRAPGPEAYWQPHSKLPAP